MASLEQSIELYKLMRDRCMASSLCKNQAQVYSEMVDFIQSCDSLEDSMQKIKNSPYYLAPSVSLMKDKLEAWKMAAIENNMPELVDVYQEKLDAIETNQQEIYVTGYEQTAQNIKNDYLNTMQAFANIFVSYVSYLCSEENTHVRDIEKFANELKKPSSDFSELSTVDTFRNLIPLQDIAYSKFVEDICNLLIGNQIETFFKDFDENIDADFDEISNSKKEIIEAGKSGSWNINYEKVKATSPDWKNDADASELKYKYEGQV